MAEVRYIKPFAPKNLDSLLSDFKNHLFTTDRAASAPTYLTATRAFGEWIVEKYDSFNPASISPLDVVEYRSYMQGKKGKRGKMMSPLTINKNLVALRMFFNWLKETGQVRDNPIAGIKSIAIMKKSAPKWLERREQAALIHAVQEGGKLRDLAMIMTMLHAGLRISEVCALDRADIEISERKGLLTVRRGKGNKSRVIPLNKTVRKVLANWMKENPKGPLFPNRYGKPISIDGVEKMFGEYAYRAKLKGISPHSLRHCFCKNLIDQGVPIDQVAMLAGHSSLDITRRYTAPSMADLQSAVDKTAWE